MATLKRAIAAAGSGIVLSSIVSFSGEPAFGKPDNKIVDYLLKSENKTKLTCVLYYHLVSGQFALYKH